MSNETVLNGRYRLVAQQGSGGMAVIYKAIDQALGRTVAVKILRPSLTNDPAFLARFRNEARSVANLAHPNIVTVHDVGSDGPTHYIVMEFIEGQDLKRIIKTEGGLSVERAIHLAIQICAGIGFAHRAGLVHADVKPQNILVTREDGVKVTDFGIAQALSDAQPGERQAVVWGSPHYFAPEQAKGEKPSPAADVYSIGIVLFEMLTGRLPYTGANQQELALAHIRERVPMVTEFNPTIPENLAKIVYKTMSKDPVQRYRLADQLGHILISYRDRGREQPAAPVPPPPTIPTVQARPPQPSFIPQAPQIPQAPLQVGDPLPTQRYDLAPQAPVSGAPFRQLPAQPGAPAGSSRPFSTQGMSAQNSGYYHSQPLPPRRSATPTLDVLTVGLALLAFFAVACLIPLYIAVFQTQFR